ncbi:MAG: hypothetical protein JWO36_5085, partial [Myxococcales bacterium]|nr:hypothetical protein [Myxococcales bacterium]
MRRMTRRTATSNQHLGQDDQPR